MDGGTSPQDQQTLEAIGLLRQALAELKEELGTDEGATYRLYAQGTEMELCRLEVSVGLRKTIRCSSCYGTGEVDDEDATGRLLALQCWECRGSGVVPEPFNGTYVPDS